MAARMRLVYKNIINNATLESAILKRLVEFLIPTIIVLAIAGGYYYWSQGQLGPGKAAQQPRTPVTAGDDYYVLVKLVELMPTDAKGKTWDSVNDSGPDIMVEIHWRGQRVYRSTTKSDSFVAKWSAAEIDLRKIALSGEATSVESVIKAARVNITPGEELKVTVYDIDFLNEGDEAGSLIVPTSELILGEHIYTNPAPAIKRIVLKVVSMDASPEMLQ